jgi:hypothetical protein
MNHSGNLRDLLYRPGIDESRYETMPFDPSAAPPAYETMPYYPDSQEDERANLGALFLEQFLSGNPEAVETAGPSFNLLPDIDSSVMDRYLEEYRQRPGYTPPKLNMDEIRRNILRARALVRGV